MWKVDIEKAGCETFFVFSMLMATGRHWRSPLHERAPMSKTYTGHKRSRRVWVALMATACLGLTAPFSEAARAQVPAAEDWPMFMHDSRHTGVSSEVALGASNASQLRVKWQANTGSPSYTSPSVVRNEALGRTLVYQGNQGGAMGAYDAETGERVWLYKLPAHIQSSPAVVENVIYFGASDHHLYALNATTGALLCRFKTNGVISSSPVVSDVDGTGLVAYFGENGLGGSDDGGSVYAVNAVDPNSAVDCSKRWQFAGFGATPGSEPMAGAWSPPALAVDPAGRPLVVFGSSSPDNSVYAVDARTGERVWRFQTEIFLPDNDVGAGPTISPPGVNGFTDGVAYIAGKNKIVYALNLRTGTKIWEFRVAQDYPGAGAGNRSTAALLGDRIYFGYGKGVYALNARTGTKVWNTAIVGAPGGEVVSSPAISGGDSDRVLFVGDLTGLVSGYNLATGAKVWRHQTGNFVYGSAAVSGGKVFIASADGFLYAFSPTGGGASAPPDTSITYPTDSSTVTNPNGSLTVTGSATDDTNVDQLLVAVKNRNTNRWWDGATRTWVNVFTQNGATLAAPGATSTTWSYSFPVPPEGGPFFAQAEAVDRDGQHDPNVAIVNFTVTSLGSPPETTITSPTKGQVYFFESGRATFPVTIEGTASDTSGAIVGVRKVFVAIKNRQHEEWYCGSVGCGGGTSSWSPVYKRVEATLGSPGATSTTWRTTIQVFDHPHSYFVSAWAVDADRQQDQTRAMVPYFCVRDPGDTTCSSV